MKYMKLNLHLTTEAERGGLIQPFLRNSTRTLGQFAAITAMVGPPTYPAPMQQIFKSKLSLIFYCILYCERVEW